VGLLGKSVIVEKKIQITYQSSKLGLQELEKQKQPKIWAEL
jgi:hypothetical protein